MQTRELILSITASCREYRLFVAHNS